MSYFEFPHSRTYEQDIGWMLATVKDLLERVNALQTKVDSFDTDVSDLQNAVTELQSEMSTFQTQMNARFDELSNDIESELSTQYAALTKQLNEAIARAEAQIAALEVEVNKKLAEAEAQIDAKIEDLEDSVATAIADIYAEFELLKLTLYEYIDLVIEEFKQQIPSFEDLQLYNPYTHELEDAQDVIDYIVSNYRAGAITFTELQDLQLTVDEFNTFVHNGRVGIIAGDFDTAARFIFADLMNREHSVRTGAKVSPKQNALIIMNDALAADTMSLAEISALNMSVATFNALEITAFDLDHRSNTVLAGGA